MAKVNIDKMIEKQNENRYLTLRQVNMGLIANDVLMNSKQKIMEDLLLNQTEENKIKYQVITDI